MMIRISLIASAILLAGCYRFTPVPLGTVPPGTEVRIQLSDEGQETLEGFTGSPRSEVGGQLIEWGEDVVLSVRVPAVAGMVDRGLRSRVSVAANHVIAVDVRERDRTKTAILTGSLIIVAGVAIAAAISGVFGGNETVIDPGEEEGALLPIWPSCSARRACR